MADRHSIDAVVSEHGVELALGHRAGDRRSAVDDALHRHLRIRFDGSDGLHAFDEHRRVLLSAKGGRFEVLLLDENGPVRLGAFVHRGRAIEVESGYRLSPFELRYAADNGVIHPIPVSARDGIPWTPITDLHTHFAACVRAADLVELGAAHGLVYPRALFEEARIHVSEDTPIAKLSPTLRERLSARLEIPLDRRVTFLEMERIYRLRAPLTKSRALLVPLCEKLARDYAAMGVRYVELSLGDVVQADVLRTMHRELPRIEAETGVGIRFLVGISRHDDPEWDLDLVERIISLSESVYVAGVDFMGHETNSTRVFAPIISAIAAFADSRRPGFVVRVHAGESPSHPENVRLAIETTRGHAVELRIGHGLYGVDEPTLEALARSRTIVEFNLDSNVALNHVQSARNLNLRRYVDAGVDVVLGSDGYGIYQTSPPAAAQAALLAGLGERDLRGPLAATEAAVIARAEARDAPRRAAVARISIPDDPPPIHFTPAVVARRREQIAVRDRELLARLATIGVTVIDPEELRAKAIVSIAGAWRHSWEALDRAAQSRIQTEMTALVAGLDPTEIVLITGGTRFGVEGIIGRAAIERGFMVVGALVRETPPASLDPGSMTHACLIGETLYDKAAGLYDLVASRNGVAIFVAGGQIVSDEIQTAKNLRLDFLLMDDVGGASGHHAATRPRADTAFRTASEALRLLDARRHRAHASHWFVGPNPTVDAVVIRRGRGHVPEILLVLRDEDAPALPGKWALPGGFVASLSPRGERWVAAETTVEACVRELREETGLAVDASVLREVGVFEGEGRDPRDTLVSWSRTTVFLVELADGSAAFAGGDDAADAKWFSLTELPELAFDHRRILDVIGVIPQNERR